MAVLLFVRAGSQGSLTEHLSGSGSPKPTRTPPGTFTPLEIIQEVQAATTRFAESTIRIHVCAHMCKQAPVNAAVVYNDLDRVGHGLYRLRSG